MDPQRTPNGGRVRYPRKPNPLQLALFALTPLLVAAFVFLSPARTFAADIEVVPTCAPGGYIVFSSPSLYLPDVQYFNLSVGDYEYYIDYKDSPTWPTGWTGDYYTESTSTLIYKIPQPLLPSVYSFEFDDGTNYLYGTASCDGLAISGGGGGLTEEYVDDLAAKGVALAIALVLAGWLILQFRWRSYD